MAILGKTGAWCLTRDEASESINTSADDCIGILPGTRPPRASIPGQNSALVSNQGRGL